jgi:hypothetical protein
VLRSDAGEKLESGLVVRDLWHQLAGEGAFKDRPTKVIGSRESVIDRRRK